MLKKITAVIACFAIAASVVGCGKKAVTFDTSDWGDMEIRVAGYRLFNDDPLNYEFAAGADKFTEEYGTKVSFMVGGGDGLGDDLVSGIMSGDPWEVQYCFGISVFPLTFAEELYTPITEYLDFENNDKIDKLTVEGTKWLGEYYGVSALPMQEVLYIAYNETWMNELGIKTPYEYYKEGKWDMEAYKEINKAGVALGANSKSMYTRPHVPGKYMSEWNDETGEVTVTYDCPENVEWLSYWGELLTNPQYNITTVGKVSLRNIIMRDQVMPNLIKDELNETTTDTIRYINYPNKDGGPGAYLTDSHFLFPQGVSEEKLPCAFMLACYMVDSKSEMVTEETYKPNMNEEDFAIWEETLDNAYYLPRIFYNGIWEMGDKFLSDMNAGKAVATHIAENTEVLKARSEEFNEKYVDGYEAK